MGGTVTIGLLDAPAEQAAATPSHQVDERVMMLIDSITLQVPTLQDEAPQTWMHDTRVPSQVIRDMCMSLG